MFGGESALACFEIQKEVKIKIKPWGSLIFYIKPVWPKTCGHINITHSLIFKTLNKMLFVIISVLLDFKAWLGYGYAKLGFSKKEQ